MPKCEVIFARALNRRTSQFNRYHFDFTPCRVLKPKMEGNHTDDQVPKPRSALSAQYILKIESQSCRAIYFSDVRLERRNPRYR